MKIRVCVTRCGYAVIEAPDENTALEKAASLSEHDFDWEKVDHSLISDTAEVVETLGENEF